jgi:hypothetical protein
MTGVLPALARVEALRVVRHPGVLLGVLAACAWLPAIDAEAVVAQDEIAVLGMLTFLVGFLNVDRVRRDGADDLYAATPSPRRVRTGAVLLSMLAAGAIASIFALVSWLVVVGLDGEVVHDGFAVRPSPLEAAQGPFLVTAVGALGVFVGRWTARPVLAPILMVGLLVGPVGWNIPWIVNGTAALAPGDWTLGDPAWHLVFLSGIGLTSAGLALVRDSRRRGAVALLVAGLVALIAGAALQ